MTDFAPENRQSPAPQAPAPAPTPAPPPPRSDEVPLIYGDQAAGTGGQAQGRRGGVVKGRIDVADEVVEKVAGLAAMEVEGVADLGGDVERAIESMRERIGIGNKRVDQGVKARMTGRDVSIDVTIMIEYGHVVMEVARRVQANVAAQSHRMLGLNVAEVNVTVDDVRMPRARRDEPSDVEGGTFAPDEG